MKSERQDTTVIREKPSKPKLALIGGPFVGLRGMMVSLLRDEFDVHVFGSDKSASHAIISAGGQFHLYRLNRGLHPLSDIMTVIELARILRALHPDVVHAYDSKPAALARLAAKLVNVPTIIGTIPGMGSLYSNSRMSTRIKRGLYELVQGAACRISTVTILQNEDDRAEFVQRGVISHSKALVVPGSGIDTRYFRPGRLTSAHASRLRSSLGVMEGQTLVIMVTRVMRSKGVLDFAAAAEQLERLHPGRYRFVLVGTLDRSSSDSPDSAEQALIGRAVNWVGHRDDIADLLSVSDVFAFPTYYREGVPRALMEAAACSLGLVVTDMPGCRDVVVHQETGLLIPPRDLEALCQAIGRAAREPERTRFGNSARRRMEERFDIQIISQQLARLYWATLADT